ncbi:MAG: hypothetical protein EPO55_08540 [Reyranella sp.]|uniref:hypothetical protein n=1 Tax=Reyranella sp. TaxID=1929291 RepID=UPI0012283BDA|nr:hypothetical protein [Reyranella sp.]TAJ40556.1 MAG: hypothetical protein EPO55_08540 [Reyranella sp.]
MHGFRMLAIAGLAGLALGACGKSSGNQDKLAYEVCLASAKKDARVASAAFATLEQSKITGSTGEEEIRVNIPYELDGKKALFQCIAQKQADGSFKVIF